jgi:WD40-like Beta Propeller Repeat
VERLIVGGLVARPCGDRLVYTRIGRPDCASCIALLVRDPDGSERELARAAPGQALRDAACDAPARRVVYAHADGQGVHTQADLWLVPIEGGAPRRLTSDGRQNSSPAFHPDGRSVVFSSNRGGAINLWERALAEGAVPQQLTFGEGPDLAVDVAPDGKTVIYNVDFTAVPLFAQPLDGGPRRRVTMALADLDRPSVTPDGRTLVAHADAQERPRVVVVPLDGGEERTLADGVLPSLTLDGREVVYLAPGERIVALPLGGGTPRLLAAAPGRVRRIVVGGDGQVHLAVAEKEGFAAWRVPLAGGAAEREAPSPVELVVPAPRGGWRAEMVGLAARREVRLYPPGAPREARPATAFPGMGFTWASDGTWGVYVTERAVRRHTIAGEDAPLFDALGWDPGLALSPDGKTVYLPRPMSHVRRQLIVNYGDRPRPR